MGIEPFLIASTLVCVISQRLVRRLCPKCKEQYQPDKEMLGRIGLTLQVAQEITFYKPVGCDECLSTGYKGRLPVFEVMEVTDKVARLIVQRADASIIMQEAISSGMTQLGTDGLRNVKAGLTSIEEVLTVAYVEEPLEE